MPECFASCRPKALKIETTGTISNEWKDLLFDLGAIAYSQFHKKLR